MEAPCSDIKNFNETRDVRVFRDSLDVKSVLEQTRERGYAFVADALESDVLCELQNEIDRLGLEVGDHVTHPINAGTSTEVKQLHARAYTMLGDTNAPVYASELCRAMSGIIKKTGIYPDELSSWLLNEIGYQRYRSSSDWIGPHRDRRTDELLSFTFTISGSAWIHVYESEVDPPDYRRLRKIDSFLTQPGTVMVLRAPGFGSGIQKIHEVMPPENGKRDILNLRMRPRVLPRPQYGRELIT